MQATIDTKLKWKLLPEQKTELIELYCANVNNGTPEGQSIVSFICKKYSIDHSTVYYHIKRAGVFQAGLKGRPAYELRSIHQSIQMNGAVGQKQAELCYTDDDGSKLNMGHDYAYYLTLEKERNQARRRLINKVV